MNTNDEFNTVRTRQPEGFYSGTGSVQQPKSRRKTTYLLSVVLCFFMLTLFGIDYVLQPQRFPTKHIDVIGNLANTSSSQVVAAVAKVSANNILRVDIAKAAEAAQSLPWVEGATIRRVWPDTLQVQVNERVIRARWNENEFLDQIGTPFSLPDFHDTELPSLIGPHDSAQAVLAAYVDWNRSLASVGLEIRSIKLTERGSWEMLVSQTINADGYAGYDDQAISTSSLKVIVGSGNIVKSIERFFKVYSEVFEPVHDEVAIIDLRYPDGVSVTWKNAPPKITGSLTVSSS